MTSSPVRVALLSAWHVHAIDYLREARALEGIEVVGFWDDDAARGRAFAQAHRLELEPDLDVLLARADVEAVICTTATRDHRAVLTRAAEAGKHIFTEKVLAASRADAAAIVDAVHAAGVVLVGSLPRLSGGAYRAARRALDEGRLGPVAFARCRVAHDGAVDRTEGAWLPERFLDADAAQGGALIDLGAHPIYLLAQLLGRPVAVTARLAAVTDRARAAGVDDTSVVIAEHEGGALSVAETGFSTAPGGLRLELHGADAIFEADDAAAWLTSRGGERREVALPGPSASPMAQWRDRIRGGAAPTAGEQELLTLTDVNEAAAVSARQGVRVELPAVR